MECVTSFVSGGRWRPAPRPPRTRPRRVGAGVLEPAEILGQLDGFLRRLADDPQAAAPRGESRHQSEMALDGQPFPGQHLDHAQASRRVDRVGADLRPP